MFHLISHGFLFLFDASHPTETRVVLKSENNIEDYEYEGLKNSLIKNNIYLGKVSRIEPSLQAAFVDFGRERHGFLSFNDIQSDYYQIPQSDLEKIKEEEEKLREELSKKVEEKEEEKDYLKKRLEDIRLRHLKWSQTPFLQEPHVKEGCGGLRDYHNLIWINYVRRKSTDIKDLVKSKML